MNAMVFGDTSESVDEVISPRFLLSQLSVNRTITQMDEMDDCLKRVNHYLCPDLNKLIIIDKPSLYPVVIHRALQ